MESTETLSPSEPDQAALTWARSWLSVQGVEEIGVDDGGSKSFRLDFEAGAAFLKLLPAHRIQGLQGITGVARRFPADVPAVLAVDAQMGWLLTAHHGGEELNAEDREPQLGLLLSSLASIQARASSDTVFLDGLAAFEPASMPQNLLSFLERRKPEDGSSPTLPGADSFIGGKAATRFLALLRSRLPLLTSHVGTAAHLPRTLIHGDLRVENGALRDDGTCVVSDWDECAAGPAGTCLFGVFDGCTVPAILLSRWATTGTPVDSEDGRLLALYVRSLVDAGYASEQALLAGLAGALCAGQIRAIVNHEQFPGLAGSRGASQALSLRLENLLDLCDWLSTKGDDNLAMAMVADYESQGEYKRARLILQDQVSRHPERADLFGRYGLLSRYLGDVATAEEACREATRLDPANTAWWLELGRACLEKLDFDGCREGLQHALAIDMHCADSAALQGRLHEIESAVEVAATPAGWPQVKVSDEERARGRLDPERLALVVLLFKKYGAVQLDNVFDPVYIESLHQVFLKRYEQQLDEKKQDNHLQVGDRRFMLTMEMEGEFGAHEFYASGMLLPAMKRILGDDLIMNSYTTVISLPGSELQHVHKDHTALFEPEGGWHMNLPSFVAQIIVPLIPMDLQTGSTRTVKGSQGKNFDEVEGMPTHDPIMPPGSCMIIDYATVHYGLPNLSQRVRPIACLGFAKPWFRDFWNYHLQAPMQFTQAYYRALPDEVRKLLAWRDIERRTANRD